MLRRTILLALAGLALAAPQALAKSQPHWYSQMHDATETASRSPGGCTVHPGWKHGSLLVTCGSKQTATFVYSFPVGHGGHSGPGHGGIQGKPTSSVNSWGRARLHQGVNVSGDSLRVTVTVTGGTVQLYSVSVGYYAS